MRGFIKLGILTVATGLLAGGAFAQGSGGGGGSPTTNSEVAYCVQRGPDGKPVNKLSSEEVCPTYQFWREDCRTDGKMGIVNESTLGHCSPAAMGLSDRDISTGSIIR